MRTIDFTYRNYHKFTGSGETFSASLAPCDRIPSTYYEEFCRAIRHIYSLKTGNFYLMYSGGLDSEYVLAACLSLGIDIIPVIVRLQPDYNQHDVDYAIRFCQKHGVKPLYIDIDFDDFVKSGKMLEVATEVRCGAYQVPATMYAAEQLDGTILVADGDTYCGLDVESNQWNYVEMEHVRAWETWFEIKGKNGTPMVMGYTPEMVLSVLLDPVMVELTAGRIPGKLGSFSSKIHVYSRWFEFEPRTKFTGYEYIEKSPIFCSAEMSEVLAAIKDWQGRYRVPYSEMVDHLTAKIRG